MGAEWHHLIAVKCSHERTGRLVRDLQIRFNGSFQLPHAAMRATSNLFLRKSGKPSFDQVDPGGAGRREVHMKSRALHQPGADGRGLVSAVVVED